MSPSGVHGHLSPLRTSATTIRMEFVISHFIKKYANWRPDLLLPMSTSIGPTVKLPRVGTGSQSPWTDSLAMILSVLKSADNATLQMSAHGDLSLVRFCPPFCLILNPFVKLLVRFSRKFERFRGSSKNTQCKIWRGSDDPLVGEICRY